MENLVDVEINAVANDFSCSLTGDITYRFLSLKGDDGYSNWVRADLAEGAIVGDRATSPLTMTFPTAADRYSATDVEIELPLGTIMKKVISSYSHKQRRGSKQIAYRLSKPDDKAIWESLGPVKSKKKNGTYVSVIEIDGIKTEIH